MVRVAQDGLLCRAHPMDIRMDGPERRIFLALGVAILGERRGGKTRFCVSRSCYQRVDVSVTPLCSI